MIQVLETLAEVGKKLIIIFEKYEKKNMSRNINDQNTLIDGILKKKLKLGSTITAAEQNVYERIRSKIDQRVSTDVINIVCQIPETFSIQNAINACEHRKIPYSSGNQLKIDKIPPQMKTLFLKYQCTDDVAEILKVLSTHQCNPPAPDPTVFDGILIRYYNRPLAFFPNEKVENDMKFGYCLVFELSHYRSHIYNKIEIELERILTDINIDRLSQVQTRVDQSQNVIVIVASLVTVVLAVGAIWSLGLTQR